MDQLEEKAGTLENRVNRQTTPTVCECTTAARGSAALSVNVGEVIGRLSETARDTEYESR